MNNSKKVVTIFIIIFAILFAAFLIISILKNIEVKKEEKEIIEQIEINRSVQEENMIPELREKYNNKDIVMRIVFDDLGIDSVITQYKDNKYYLNHDAYKKKSVLGSIFMDYRNTKKDQKINIYGHNSRKYDVPFRKLEKYLDEEYYRENSIFTIYDEEGEHKYQIFSIYPINKDNKTHMVVKFKSDEELKAYVKKAQQGSIHENNIEIDKSSKFIFLQTCLYDKKLGDYLILAAQEIKK